MTVSRDRASAEQEFERLYQESYELVYNYVRYLMHDESAAEDVVAEAFLLAARSFSKFDPSRAKFSTWVIKITTNYMNNYYRKVHPALAIDNIPDTVLSNYAEPAAEDAICDHELVVQLLGCLDETERHIVVMKYREGYRNSEIAEALSMNPSTVSTVLSRSLIKIRAEAEKVSRPQQVTRAENHPIL